MIFVDVKSFESRRFAARNGAIFFHFVKKMAREKKTMGIGAVVSALIRVLHPFQVVRDKYPNPQHGERLHDLLVIGRELRTVNNRLQMTILMRHDHFDGDVLYCVEKFVRVETSGAAEHYFNAMQPTLPQPAQENDQEELLPPDVVPFLDAPTINPTDAQIVAAVVPTDDDNEPAPENIPQPDNAPPPQGQWGHNNICSRRATGVHDSQPSIRIGREFPLTMFRILKCSFSSLSS